MKKCWGKKVGCCLIALGVTVILALILPSAVWWFLLGACLIAVGVLICRRRV